MNKYFKKIIIYLIQNILMIVFLISFQLICDEKYKACRDFKSTFRSEKFAKNTACVMSHIYPYDVIGMQIGMMSASIINARFTNVLSGFASGTLQGTIIGIYLGTIECDES